MEVTKSSRQIAIEAESATAQNIANKHNMAVVVFTQEIATGKYFVGFQLMRNRDIKEGQWFKYGSDDLFAEAIIYPSKSL